MGSHAIWLDAHTQDIGSPSRITGQALWVSTMLRCGLPRSVVGDHCKPSWASTSGKLDGHHALELATTSGHEVVLGGHAIRRGEPRNRALAVHEAFGRPRCAVGVQVSCRGRLVCCVSCHVIVCGCIMGAHTICVGWRGCPRESCGRVWRRVIVCVGVCGRPRVRAKQNPHP